MHVKKVAVCELSQLNVTGTPRFAVTHGVFGTKKREHGTLRKTPNGA
jgi:hypothetical protein